MLRIFGLLTLGFLAVVSYLSHETQQDVISASAACTDIKERLRYEQLQDSFEEIRIHHARETTDSYLKDIDEKKQRLEVIRGHESSRADATVNDEVERLEVSISDSERILNDQQQVLAEHSRNNVGRSRLLSEMVQTRDDVCAQVEDTAKRANRFQFGSLLLITLLIFFLGYQRNA